MTTHRESAEWEQTYVRLRRNRTRRRRRLIWFDLPRHGRILDFGCGDGLNLEILHELGYQNLIGVDVSPALLARVKNYRVAESDGLRTPFADGSFDGVLVDSVLHHLDVAAAARELARIIRPSGRLSIVEPGGGITRRVLDWLTFSSLARFVRTVRARRESVREEWTTYSRWLEVEKNVPAILAEHGFTLLRQRRVPLNLFLEAVRNED